MDHLIPPIIDLDGRVNPAQSHFEREFVKLPGQRVKIPRLAFDEGPHVMEQMGELGFFQELVNLGDVFADAFSFPNLGTDYDLHDSHNFLLSKVSLGLLYFFYSSGCSFIINFYIPSSWSRLLKEALCR
jgi:hypothetical protein